MAFVSFAPNREDAILWRALESVERGTYFDVGRCDPDVDSVTRAFSERGWRGVNVVATPAGLALARQFRPLDASVALEGAASAVAAWRDHVRGPVHFVNVDVAPNDSRAVLEALDLARGRPWIVVVARAHPDLDNLFRDAGYVFARPAGATRIWAASDRAGVLQALQAGDAAGVVTGPEHEAAEETKLLRKQRDRLLTMVTSGGGGFDAQKHPHLAPYLGGPLPSLAAPQSQLCTQGQMDEPLYRRWCGLLRENPCAHRKQWEFVYIMQALWTRGVLRPGSRGLGFGCGNEPLASAMAAYGCEVVATDLDPDDERSKDWRETDQHAAGKVDALNTRSLCPPDLFAKQVRYRNADMNRIPEDLRGFDFVWSSCALEHIGSIRHGLDFIHNSIKCLKPGGVAVHTTEFNLTSNGVTLESPGLSFFRALDLETVAAELGFQGHEVAPFNLHPGDTLLDKYVDLPPFEVSALHLRLKSLDHTITSVGMIVRRAAGAPAPRDLTGPETEAHERALEPLIARMEADPHDVSNFLALARVLEAAGDFAKARQCLEVALDQNPKEPALWQALVDQSLARSDAIGAANDARDALAQLPSDGEGDWHLRVARACLARGAPAEARAWVEDGLAALPFHAALLRLRAAVAGFAPVRR
jgi:2-polyprenyl-3-methyl-5-hydroxy-6-metoxy-1,4-benzoquinol methylase